MPKKPDVPGSSRKGEIDTRSTDADGQQADEVASHAERAGKTPKDGDKPRDESSGAFKDQVGR